MPIEVLNGPTIHSGDSLSDAVDCRGGVIIKITMPQNGFDGSDLTFQTSSDDVGYNDIMRPDGNEVLCKAITGTAIIGMDLITGFIKFRAGTRQFPVPQTDIRTFAIAILKPPVIQANLAIEQKY